MTTNSIAHLVNTRVTVNNGRSFTGTLRKETFGYSVTQFTKKGPVTIEFYPYEVSGVSDSDIEIGYGRNCEGRL